MFEKCVHKVQHYVVQMYLYVLKQIAHKHQNF